MKIGFVSVFNYGSSIGGVENHIYFVSQELSKRGHEVIIFQPYESICDSEVNTFLDGDVRVVKIPVKPNVLTSFLNRYNGAGMFGFVTGFINKAKYSLHFKKIARCVVDYDCNLIHQHDFISSMLLTKYLSRKGTPCVLTNHTGEYLFFKKSSVGRFLLKFMLAHYSAVIGPSKELTPEDVKGAITIHNGVDLDVFSCAIQADKNKIKTEYGLGPNDFVVLCPRRWAPTKGVLYLIQSIVSEHYSKNIKFLFAGSDYDGYKSYRASLINIIEGCNKKDQIKLLGNLSISQMVDVYNISDVVVIPSLMEAVSLSAIEAMSCGAVVVSTDVGGMPELIKHGYNGVLIPAKSPAAIFNSISLLFQDSVLLGNLQDNGFSTVKNYTWSTIAAQTEAVYLEV